jgi:hypothetical protein
MSLTKVKIISNTDENKFESDLNAYLKYYSDKDLSVCNIQRF